MRVKTRFAPSPTGSLHLGSARTALYSWLFARKNCGIFLLRMENTDLNRSVDENISIILEEMRWLNLNWDEGPYFQTDRLNRYNTVIEKMLKNGTAYRCYCSKDRLQDLRYRQKVSGVKPKYDGFCRNKKRLHAIYSGSTDYVVRFCNPQNGLVVFNDQIRGLIKFRNIELDDLVIRRSDGMPTYNFCVVIDDMDMGITHVIRGEDHISNTPRQINIFKALDAPIPQYAHLSMIFGSDGKKLSKRCNALSITEYRNNGFLPEAVLNYLVRLGWSYGDQEIFNLLEMQKLFSLDLINISSSILNVKKLLWLNSYYINHLPVNYVACHLGENMNQLGIDYSIGPCLIDMVKLFKKRYKTLKGIACNCQYFYNDFFEYNDEIGKKYLSLDMKAVFEVLRVQLSHLNMWTLNAIQEILLSIIDELKINKTQISMSLRVAITGGTCSPELISVLYLCGRVRVLQRLDMALDYIGTRSSNILILCCFILCTFY